MKTKPGHDFFFMFFFNNCILYIARQSYFSEDFDIANSFTKFDDSLCFMVEEAFFIINIKKRCYMIPILEKCTFENLHFLPK